ncbi:MAG: ATP-dependent DNA helicase RecG [Christensenellales bacterium]
MRSLEQTLDQFKGVGPKKLAQLNKLGLYNVADMLRYLPRDYLDLSAPKPACALQPGEYGVFCGRFEGLPKNYWPRRGLRITRYSAFDDTGKIVCVWFNQPYAANRIRPDRDYLIYGKMDIGGHMQNPELFDPETQRCILPIYRVGVQVSQNLLRDLARLCLDRVKGALPETLPASFRERYRLAELNSTYQNIHFPKDQEALSIARRRLAFEELLFFQLFIARRKAMASENGQAFQIDRQDLENRIAKLSFQLTNSQRAAWEDIVQDLGKIRPMSRIVQGDVGCGKTVVALMALYVAARNGVQGAIMAPTEVLASQHLQETRRFFEGTGIQVGGLSGRMKAAERREALACIRSGAWQIVCGTQALIQEGASFDNLGLVVADEQHRFGVAQRARLMQKGKAPHVLLMSATPIPRTLSLILYGDLDLSTIDELPPNRSPVKTQVVPPSKRKAMFGYLRERIAAKEQVYIVCPLVEDGETADIHAAQSLYDELRCGAFSGLPVGLLHGKMKSADKAAALSSFANGETRALVSTTVIEVGVHVPSATIMVIMDADRFGLSQLHQLRGRVGRGSAQSRCFLYSDSPGDIALQRLSLLEQCHSGFEIAQKDLEMRGPGQFLGNRQHGAGSFKMARLMQDTTMLAQTQNACREILASEQPENADILAAAMRHYEALMQDVALN